MYLRTDSKYSSQFKKKSLNGCQVYKTDDNRTALVEAET
jgi:hypothetical protein